MESGGLRRGRRDPKQGQPGSQIPIRFPKGIQPREKFVKPPPRKSPGLRDESFQKILEERERLKKKDADAKKADEEFKKPETKVDIRGLWEHFDRKGEDEEEEEDIVPGMGAPVPVRRPPSEGLEFDEEEETSLEDLSLLRIIKLKFALRRTKIIVMLVVLAIILTPLFVLQLEEPEGPKTLVQLDGRFNDWEPMEKYKDSLDEGSAEGTSSLDITQVALAQDKSRYYVYIEVSDDFLLAGDILNATDDGKNNVADSVLIFIDTDPSKSDGYSVYGIKADLMVEINGFDGIVSNAALNKYNERFRTYEKRTIRDEKDWNAWEFYSWANIGVFGTKLEVGFDIDRNSEGSPGDYEFVIQTHSHSGSYDFFDRVLAPGQGELHVKRTDNQMETITPAELAESQNKIWMFSLEVANFGSDSSLDKLTLKKSGTIDDADVFSLQLFEDTDSDRQYSSSDKQIVNTVYGFINGLNDLELPADERGLSRDETKLLHLVAELKSGSSSLAGTTFGIELERRGIYSDAVVTYLKDSFFGDKLHYLHNVPGEIVIDGAFGDWTGNNVPQAKIEYDSSQESNSNINILKYGHYLSEPNLAVFMTVAGNVLEGDTVPVYRRQYFTPSSDYEFPRDLDNDGRVDSDSDGLEEGYDTRDDDFDNNDIPDEVDPDIDGDLVPNDVDLDDRNVAVGEFYPDLPERLGLDIMRVYIDLDGEPGTGYNLAGTSTRTGAELLVEFRGRAGEIYLKTASRYVTTGTVSGFPEWQVDNDMTDSIDVGNDLSSLEASLDLTNVIDLLKPLPGDNINLFFVLLLWDGSEVDFSNELEPAQYIPGTRSASVGLPATTANEYHTLMADLETHTKISRIHMTMTSVFAAAMALFLWKLDFFTDRKKL
jgi:hypothetical protein